MPGDSMEGAAPPFIVHTNQSESATTNAAQNENDSIKLSSRFVEGLQNPNSGFDAYFKQVNPNRFTVRSTKSGSMTQEIFLDWCIHFVKHLPKGQGQGGTAHLLFLDGHASRWNLQGLQYLMGNNVFPFFLPSHTSIWTQPNDNGCNLRFHKCVEDAIKRL